MENELNKKAKLIPKSIQKRRYVRNPRIKSQFKKIFEL